MRGMEEYDHRQILVYQVIKSYFKDMFDINQMYIRTEKKENVDTEHEETKQEELKTK